MWPTATLEELAAPIDGSIAIGPFGSSMKADVYVDDGTPVIRGTNLDGSPGFSGDFVYVNDATVERLRRCIVEPGDLVFPHRGAIGSVGIATEASPGRWLLSTSMMKFRPDPERLDPLFGFYYFRSNHGQHEILKFASQVGTPGIGQPLTSLRSWQIPLPPINEQRRIASILGSLDDKIEHNRRTAQALERLARAIFKAWFVDFEPVKAKAEGATSFPSMPQDVFDAQPTTFVDTETGPVPEGWGVRAIGDVVTVVGGATPSTKEPAYWDDGELCFATPKDLSKLTEPILLDTEKHITRAGADRISSGLLPRHTVLLSSRAPIGYLALTAIPTCINQGFIAMICDRAVPPSFILNWTWASLESIKARAGGTTFPEISKKNFRPIPVVTPPESDLSAFDAKASTLYVHIELLSKENARLGLLRDYLLPKLMSGEITVDESVETALEAA